jgi:hypothetical protein
MNTNKHNRPDALSRPARRVPLPLQMLCLLVVLLWQSSFASQRVIMTDTADITVTIDLSVQEGTSQLLTGMTHHDNSLKEGEPTAINKAKNLIKDAISYQNTPIMAWGISDPWPDPNQTEPSNWNSLDERLKLIIDTGGIPIITLCEAPWWMKGQLQSNGTTRLVTHDEEWAQIAFASRILDNKMDKWSRLVQRVAERYMVAPYNVRHFLVWNEMKGYYNPMRNQWDYTTSSGDPSGPNARHGYTYMYNRVYNTLRNVATAKGIDPNTIKVGGSYASLKTWAATDAGGYPTSETLLMNKPYGTYDQRDVDVMKYWLQNKAGAGLIAYDSANRNHDNVNIVNPYIANSKFQDTVRWIRSLNDTTYKGAATLPIFYAEWYSNPYDTIERNYTSSVKADGAIKFIKVGGSTMLPWGGVETTNLKTNPSLYTNTNTPTGAQPTPWYYAYKSLKNYFGRGTKLYKASSSSADLSVLASASKTMLVNKTSVSKTVSVNNVLVSLNAYEVKVIDTPSASPPDTTPPTVSITNPKNGSTVSKNSSITIQATASDASGISKVEFYVNDSLKCTDTTSNYTCLWNIPPPSNATYTLKAKAYDKRNNSATHSITVQSK